MYYFVTVELNPKVAANSQISLCDSGFLICTALIWAHIQADMQPQFAENFLYTEEVHHHFKRYIINTSRSKQSTKANDSYYCLPSHREYT